MNFYNLLANSREAKDIFKYYVKNMGDIHLLKQLYEHSIITLHMYHYRDVEDTPVEYIIDKVSNSLESLFTRRRLVNEPMASDDKRKRFIDAIMMHIYKNTSGAFQKSLRLGRNVSDGTFLCMSITKPRENTYNIDEAVHIFETNDIEKEISKYRLYYKSGVIRFKLIYKQPIVFSQHDFIAQNMGRYKITRGHYQVCMRLYFLIWCLENKEALA